MTTHVPELKDLVAALDSRDEPPLGRVGVAVCLADDLGSLGDRLVTHYVAVAREAGCSWSQIGEQLGVSKQAAQQGFVAPAPRRFGRRRTGSRFGRLTDEARAAVQAAHEQARGLRHDYIGTEHLLLGLVAGDHGVAHAVLSQAGVELAGVHGHLSAGTGEPRKGHLPFTKRAKQVMALAVDEAAGGPIGTEHLLLAVIREGEGLAAKVLVTLGADLPELRRSVLQATGRRG